MAATDDDMTAVHDLIDDTTSLLRWSGSSDSQLIAENSDERARVVAPSLETSYRAAIEQAQSEAFDLALRTLRGQNPDFPPSAVLTLLEAAGWSGALATFKLEVLEYNGRSDVLDVVQTNPTGGGGIRRRVFRGFLGALNAALDSLSGLPGVGVIKELKDFLERAAE